MQQQHVAASDCWTGSSITASSAEAFKVCRSSLFVTIVRYAMCIRPGTAVSSVSVIDRGPSPNERIRSHGCRSSTPTQSTILKVGWCQARFFDLWAVLAPVFAPRWLAGVRVTALVGSIVINVLLIPLVTRPVSELVSTVRAVALTCADRPVRRTKLRWAVRPQESIRRIPACGPRWARPRPSRWPPGALPFPWQFSCR